jgi:EAL domain-containing protein (putative c-di-GMP-specific phosphodiesterase class I)
MAALESAIEESGANRFFVSVSAAEIETPFQLFSSVKQIQGSLPGDWELGITISIPTDVDILRIAETYRQARELDLLVAFDEFQGNGGQVMYLSSYIPDYLVLAASMTKDLSATRQPLRRLESMLAACNELSIKPVLPRCDAGNGIALCQDLGFDLVLLPAARASTPLAELCVTV